jgi:hypothetical protein
MARKPPARRKRSKSLDRLAAFEDDRLMVPQIEHFFVSYNEMKGKSFEVKGRAGGKPARALVMPATTRP